MYEVYQGTCLTVPDRDRGTGTGTVAQSLITVTLGLKK
jgi:hypothetical protein